MRVCRNLILLLLLLFICETTAAQVVVANDKVETRQLTRQEIRSIFSMRMTRWPNQTPVTVFTLKSSDPLHKTFCREYLKIFPYQLQRAWDRLVFAGIGQAPRKVNSISEMKEQLRRTPGAIGYLPEDPKIDGIRVIEIIPAN